MNDENRKMNLAIQTAAIEAKIREVVERRGQQLEKLAAAFVEEVGAADASQYELVEEQRAGEMGYTTTWCFRRRTAE